MSQPPALQLTIDVRISCGEMALERLQHRLQSAIAAEEPGSVELTVVLVDDAEIHRLNREFLGHDWPTDVITFFDEDQAAGLVSTRLRGRGRTINGELVVSVETARREAARQGWSVDDELLLYCVHGWLHLCGYDDLTDEERPLMRQREREVLMLFGLTPTDLES